MCKATHPPTQTTRPARWRLWTLGLGLACCGGLLLVPPIAQADRKDEQRALAARQGGETLALDALINGVEARIPGRLLKAELEEDDGVWVYELRWQMPDGRRIDIDINAHDGRWLKLKGPRLESVFRQPGARPTPSDKGRP